MIVGFENSNSKIVVISDEKIIHYLNTVQEVRETNTSRITGKKQDTFTYEGKQYIVGSTIGIGSGSKDESRYYSEQFKKETVLALSQMLRGDFFEDNKFKIVTGVPSNLAERNDLIHKMKNNLLGEYEVIHNGIKKKFSIEAVGIAAQPIGTFYYMHYNIDGTRKPNRNGLVEKDIFQKNVLFLDIGYGTFDLAELVAGVLGNVRTLPKAAMSDYIARLFTEIEAEYPESRLSQAIESPYELDRKLISSDILTVPRGKFNVKNIKQSLQDDFAQIAKSSLDKYGYNFERYDDIVLTGGGSIILERSLNIAFNNDPRIWLVKEPILANAKGFKAIAVKTYGKRK